MWHRVAVIVTDNGSRRDGSPFMNLLMTAPLCDSRGNIRYFIGAQVDVSGLVKECAELQSLQRLLELAENGEAVPDVHQPSGDKRDEHQELCEMFNMMELSTVRRHGGRMHHEIQDDTDSYSLASQHPRLVLKEPLDTTGLPARLNGKLGGVYQHVSSSTIASLSLHPLIHNSTSSSAPTPPFEFSSPLPPNVSPASSNPPSWTKSAAPPASATN